MVRGFDWSCMCRVRSVFRRNAKTWRVRANDTAPRRTRAPSTQAAALEQLVEQADRNVSLCAGNGERRCQREDVFVIAANVEHEAIVLATDLEIALQALRGKAVRHLRVGGLAVGLADLH